MSGSLNCVLPSRVIDRIAAGEVIERLALMVKQLCENSDDAGAPSIHVDIDSGGPERIPVCAGGIGISAMVATVPQSRLSTPRSPGFGRRDTATRFVSRIDATHRRRWAWGGGAVVRKGGLYFQPRFRPDPPEVAPTVMADAPGRGTSFGEVVGTVGRMIPGRSTGGDDPSQAWMSARRRVT